MDPERLRDEGQIVLRREERLKMKVERYVYDLVSWCTLNWTAMILLNTKTVKRRGSDRTEDMTGRWNEANCPWKEAVEEYNPHGHQVLLWHSEG